MKFTPREISVRIGRIRIDEDVDSGLQTSGASLDIQAAIGAALMGTGRPIPMHSVGGLIGDAVSSRVRESIGQIPGGSKAGARR